MSVNNATGTAEDVRGIFVQDVKLNDVVQEATMDNGKKVVNIKVPYAGSRVWVATSLDGQVRLLGGTPPKGTVVPKPGDFLIVKETLGNGITKNTPYVYISYDGIQVTPIQISQMASVSLSDHLNTLIPGTIDSNGNANIKVDSLNLDTIRLNELYVDNVSIRDLIKRLTIDKIAVVNKLNLEGGVTLEEVVEKLNDLIEAVQNAANN